MAPFTFSPVTANAVAILIGFCFGFVLESSRERGDMSRSSWKEMRASAAVSLTRASSSLNIRRRPRPARESPI